MRELLFAVPGSREPTGNRPSIAGTARTSPQHLDRRACISGFNRDDPVPDVMRAADPKPELWIDAIHTALDTNQAHLTHHETNKKPGDARLWGWHKDHSNHEWVPNGPHIGWIDYPDIYLNPGPAHMIATRICRRKNHYITVGIEDMAQILANADLLKAGPLDDVFWKHTVEDREQRILVVEAKTVYLG